jgi:hypothetical protein
MLFQNPGEPSVLQIFKLFRSERGPRGEGEGNVNKQPSPHNGLMVAHNSSLGKPWVLVRLTRGDTAFRRVRVSDSPSSFESNVAGT